MTLDQYQPNRAALVLLLVPATAYLVWQQQRPWQTGATWVEGSLGLVLGLYICSRPAANGIDLFFAERGAWRRIFTRRSGVAWVLLNALVMLVGWFVIVAGATRLSTAEHSFSVFP